MIVKKKKPQEGESDASAEKKADDKGTARDPFSRFRKLFNPKSKVKGGGHGSMAATAKAGGAGRKTPAGGGSSKAGGSS